MDDKELEPPRPTDSFMETFAIVKYKLAKNKPMMSAREEMMEDFIKDWAEIFGYESATH